MHQRGEGNRRFNGIQEFACLQTFLHECKEHNYVKEKCICYTIYYGSKKNNLNTEHKKLANSYYEKEITFDYHKVAEAFISEEISIQSITSGSISEEKVKKIFKKACVLKDFSISVMKQAILSAFEVILAGESECHQESIYAFRNMLVILYCNIYTIFICIKHTFQILIYFIISKHDEH